MAERSNAETYMMPTSAFDISVHREHVTKNYAFNFVIANTAGQIDAISQHRAQSGINTAMTT
jgi:hypothetical protein